MEGLNTLSLNHVATRSIRSTEILVSYIRVRVRMTDTHLQPIC